MRSFTCRHWHSHAHTLPESPFKHDFCARKCLILTFTVHLMSRCTVPLNNHISSQHAPLFIDQPKHPLLNFSVQASQPSHPSIQMSLHQLIIQRGPLMPRIRLNPATCGWGQTGDEADKKVSAVITPAKCSV